jgi:hypothetical protein
LRDCRSATFAGPFWQRRPRLSALLSRGGLTAARFWTRSAFLDQCVSSIDSDDGFLNADAVRRLREQRGSSDESVEAQRELLLMSGSQNSEGSSYVVVCIDVPHELPRGEIQPVIPCGARALVLLPHGCTTDLHARLPVAQIHIRAVGRAVVDENQLDVGFIDSGQREQQAIGFAR